MRVKVKWDLDVDGLEGLPYKDALKESGLPSIVEVPDDIEEDFISDWISDEYGFCHHGWTKSSQEKATMKFKRVSLVVRHYVCPDTPEGVERAIEALVSDFDNARNWDPYKMIRIEEETAKDANDQVPPWLLEDLEEIYEGA